MYDVYSEFDVNKHMKYFHNYLEVIIHPDGSIHYAVPSHKVYLEMYLVDKYGCTYEEFLDMCPESWYSNYLSWLTMKSLCVNVWSYGYLYYKCTLAQKAKIANLISLKLLEPRKLKF